MGTDEMRGKNARALLRAAASASVCGELPWGSQTRIALETGFTRARVQQIAAELALEASPPTRYERACASCGKPMKRYYSRGAVRPIGPSLTCRACSRVQVACDQCGSLFSLTVADLTARAGDERYTGRLHFCNQQCHGRYRTGRPRPVR